VTIAGRASTRAMNGIDYRERGDAVVSNDLSGKVALVTGGGTGLGRAISLALADEGMDVAINYARSLDDAEATATDVRAKGRRALVIAADVADDGQVRAMAQRVGDELGRLDLLVNNAGMTVFVPFPDLDGMLDDDWDRIMAVNTKGPWLCARACVPIMRRTGGGSIINITSVSGVRAGGSCVAYCVSKGATEMLTRALAQALSPDIAVNSIAPGLMDTRWGRLWGDEHFERQAKGNLLGRIPSLEDIAATAVYLAQNASVTGRTHIVDGGALR
jgi:3-oxoacyl-[acyl-carrier protein] reductase